MTHQTQPLQALAGTDSGRQIAQLREVLALVRGVAGVAGAAVPRDEVLDEAARVSGAYGDALPIVRRRFDALVAETVAWAAAGVEALSLADTPSPAAAARLADELAGAVEEILGVIKL